MAKRKEKTAYGTGTIVAAATGVAVAVGTLAAGLLLKRRKPTEGHAAPDLSPETPRPAGTDRAPEAFRPDPTAPVSDADREALRPATGGSPSLVEDRGAVRSLP